LLGHVSVSLDSRPELKSEEPVWPEIIEVLDELQLVIQEKGIRTSLADAVQLLAEASEKIEQDTETESILIGYIPSGYNLVNRDSLPSLPRLKSSQDVEKLRQIKLYSSPDIADVATQRPNYGSTRFPNERVRKADANTLSSIDIYHDKLQPQCLIPQAENHYTMTDGVRSRVPSNTSVPSLQDMHTNLFQPEPGVALSRWSTDSSQEAIVDIPAFHIVQQLTQYEPALRLVRVIGRWKASYSKREQELRSFSTEVPAKAIRVLGATADMRGRLRR
jgi:hypothetical protein